MSCCSNPSCVASLLSEKRGQTLFVSAAESEILQSDGTSYLKLRAGDSVGLIYYFYAEAESAPLWKVGINSDADASQVGSWTVTEGSKTQAEFDALMVPGLSGTGLEFSFDLTGQTVFTLKAYVGLEVCVDVAGRGATAVVEIADKPNILLGVVTDSGVVDSVEADLINSSLGRYQFGYEADIKGSPIVPNDSTFFELKFYVGNILFATLYAAWNTNISTATAVNVGDPQDLEPGEVLDVNGVWIGALPLPLVPPVPLQYFWTGDLVMDDTTTGITLQKKNFAEIYSYIDADAKEMRLQMRVSHNNVYSDPDTIVFPVLNLLGRLNRPAYLATDGLTGNLLLVSRGGGTLRESTEANEIKTIDTALNNPQPFGIDTDPNEQVNGHEAVYNASVAALYKKTYGTGEWDDNILLPPSPPSGLRWLKVLQNTYNTYPSLAASYDSGLVVIYRGIDAIWYHITNPTLGYLRGITVDPATGDIYGLSVDTNITMYRWQVGSVTAVIGDQPTLTRTIVATFSQGDTDGAGDGTGAVGAGTTPGPDGIDLGIVPGPVVNGGPSFYMADRYSHKIKHLTLATGKTLSDVDGYQVATLGGGQGSVIGDLSVAKFFGPFDIEQLLDGSYVISEIDGAKMKRWDPTSNNVTLYLGDGTPGSQDSKLI